MTTVVYDHKNKQIAIDSRTTADGVITQDDCIKWRKINKDYWFVVGSINDFNLLIDYWYGKEEKTDIPDCAAYVICDKVVSAFEVMDDGVLRIIKQDHNDAMGSGKDWSIAALDFGKTAKQAVDYAKTKDCYSGGKVHVFDINKNKFVRG